MAGKYDPDNFITPIGERVPILAKKRAPFVVLTDEEWYRSDLYKESLEYHKKGLGSMSKRRSK